MQPFGGHGPRPRLLLSDMEKAGGPRSLLVLTVTIIMIVIIIIGVQMS